MSMSTSDVTDGSKKSEKKTKKKLLSDRMVALLAKVWDIFTIIVSFIDVISDIIVAKQFYDGGHTGWFWAVFSSLLLSNIAYTTWCIESSDVHNLAYESKIFRFLLGDPVHHADIWPKVKRFCWIFPWAQLCPTLCWLGHEYKHLFGSDSSSRGRSDSNDFFQRTGSRDSGTGGGDAADQELEDILADADFIKGMQSGLREHLESHGLFYIETIVESIPQSIVQLMAVTMIGEATGMQLFSMALSLLSIVSKAYIIAQSSDLKVFAFKFFLAAHDVFSLFYAFSSVLAADQVKTTPLEVWFLSSDVVDGTPSPGTADVDNDGSNGASSSSSSSSSVTTMVSGVSSYWFAALQWKAFIGVSLFLTGFTVAFGHDLRHNRFRLKEFCEVMFILISGFIVMFFPILFVVEGVKLSWFILLLFLMEPPSLERFPLALGLRTFCQNGSSPGEIANRVRYLYQVYLTKAEEGFASVEFTPGARHCGNLEETARSRMMRLVLSRKNDRAIFEKRTKELGDPAGVGNRRLIGDDEEGSNWFSSLKIFGSNKYRRDQGWRGPGNYGRRNGTSISCFDSVQTELRQNVDTTKRRPTVVASSSSPSLTSTTSTPPSDHDEIREISSEELRRVAAAVQSKRDEGVTLTTMLDPLEAELWYELVSLRERVRSQQMKLLLSQGAKDTVLGESGNQQEGTSPTKELDTAADGLVSLEPIKVRKMNANHKKRRIKAERRQSSVQTRYNNLKTCQMKLPDDFLLFSPEERGPHTFKPLDIFWDITVDIKGGLKEIVWADFVGIVLLILFFLGGFFQIMFALFSLAVPFYNVVMYPGHQNAFQLFCFGAMCLSLLGCLVLLPYVINFAYFSAALKTILSDYGVSLIDVRTWINQYHRPTNRAILNLTVPHRLLNHDLKELVGSFLPEEGTLGLGKKGLSLQDCLELKKGK